MKWGPMKSTAFNGKTVFTPQVIGFPSVRRTSDTYSLAKRIYALRRKRVQALAEVADLFHDPAWDILLDLFIAAKERSAISVSSACIASSVPSTTGLRMVNLLEQRGAVEIRADPFDARRRYVALTAATEAQIEKLLTSADPAQIAAI